MTDQQPLETLEPETGDFGQTRFAEEATVLPTNMPVGQAAQIKSKRSPLVTALMVLLPLTVIAMVAVLILGPQRSGGGGLLTAPPTPVASPMTESELERRFSLLADDIEAADPTKGALAFPPVDFTLDLQDATELRQRQRR